MKKQALGYFILSIMGVTLAIRIGFILSSPYAFLPDRRTLAIALLLIGLTIFGLAVLYFYMGFLYLRRFVEKIRQNGSWYELLSLSGEILTSVDSLHLIKDSSFEAT